MLYKATSSSPLRWASAFWFAFNAFSKFAGLVTIGPRAPSDPPPNSGIVQPLTINQAPSVVTTQSVFIRPEPPEPAMDVVNDNFINHLLFPGAVVLGFEKRWFRAWPMRRAKTQRRAISARVRLENFAA